jgi:hypothetical protein
MSYGNQYVQNKIVSNYKSNMQKGKSSQNFFHGLRAILEMGKKTYMSANSETSLQLTLFNFTLILIQLFCEGHNQETKDFLRFQESSSTNVDIISILSKVGVTLSLKLIAPISYLSSTSCPKLLRTIRDSSQGPSFSKIAFIYWSTGWEMPKYRDLIVFLQYLRTLVEVVGSKKHNKIEFTRSELPASLEKILFFLGAYFRKNKICGIDYSGDSRNMMAVFYDIAVLNEITEEIPVISKVVRSQRGAMGSFFAKAAMGIDWNALQKDGGFGKEMRGQKKEK